MNEELASNTDYCYYLAEEKAGHYFKVLHKQLIEKHYVPALTKDIQSWKLNHIHYPSLLSFFPRRKKKPVSKEYRSYIQYLNYTSKLDDYLERSISYIYMRDLGKALTSPNTESRVRNVVEQLKKNLLLDNGDKIEPFSMASLYKMAKKNGVESTMIWAIEKLKNVSAIIPKGMDVVHAQRKILKIIAGVVMNAIEEMEAGISLEERTNKLTKAIKIGYYYGLTYPFIDDLLDANILSDHEAKDYSNLIRTTLKEGNVPEFSEWKGKNKQLIQSIHSELKEAFLYIKANQKEESLEAFLQQSYVFFCAQEIDRLKHLSYEHYTNEELYIPVILKSSASRQIVRSLISAPKDGDFDKQTFCYGIYNQLADDFADLFDDWEEGAVTPYTYYMKHHHRRNDLINPFELYWTVIFYLIHHVYQSDKKTCNVILDRAINGLKRFKEKKGNKRYKEVMDLFASEIPAFNRLIQTMVQKADNVDFFDKLLRDQMVVTLKNEQKDQKEFFHTIKSVQSQINISLLIAKSERAFSSDDAIVDGANYSLNGNGKRIRPIIAWCMGVNEYGLDETEILPLVRSLEYMHTASLIFDDLPSQDNASIRRGRLTLHEVYNTAIAELTGLFLTQKAIEEQTNLSHFDPQTVLSLIRYTAKVTGDMCKGQAMDLESKGKQLTLNQLNTICFYKTGIGFEASLIMPAILADAKETEIAALKKFAYHAGIAFQIKDDLLDVEGDKGLLGKATGKDVENNHSTFASILGMEGARIEMWEHYCLALEALQEMSWKTKFLKHLLDYLVHRKK
ncbi:polyprenyl synthetase family protein [Niallia nealsonii]|uniref:Geranyl transferase n=1 Tax=Niallia nealsonii TaxID=115979 RepID=A0A2N0Z5A7_9BACI|nr:polyprenyl synthetase family protein [Niallia nealsonii]PKG24696.1 geranyl transferase [Niallia nealsonii]